VTPAKLLLAVFFLPSFFSMAQDGKPANQPAAPAADKPTVDNSYVIGPTDVLNVTVWKETTLSGTYLVRPDGMISMPLLGDLEAAGLTAQQLTDHIADKLKKFMQDPTVTVILTGINSKKIYLLGEVAKKGPIEMTPGMTLLQAIGTAGGLSDFANAKKIYILRSEGGTQQKIAVQYKQALKGDSTKNLVLKAGDTIVVP
jgi:polysaccharide export outer membrane protein